MSFPEVLERGQRLKPVTGHSWSETVPAAGGRRRGSGLLQLLTLPGPGAAAYSSGPWFPHP